MGAKNHQPQTARKLSQVEVAQSAKNIFITSTNEKEEVDKEEINDNTKAIPKDTTPTVRLQGEPTKPTVE